MAHKNNGRGSLVVTRKFRGVSRIRRALGTESLATVKRVNTMYSALYHQGRLDILEAIARGRLHPLVALSRWQKGLEVEMPLPELLPGLEAAWLEWEAKVPGDEHRSSIGTTRRMLGIPPGALIGDLPGILADYVKANTSKRRSIELAKTHCLTFLSDVVGTSHAIHARARDVKLPRGRRKPRERGTPHAMAAILELVLKLNAARPQAGDMAWSMASTGMGNKEYWVDGFEVLEDRVLIHGDKRDQRDRTVPRWAPELIIKPRWGEDTFATTLREVSADTVGIYDFRRSFARWCEEAHIIKSNRSAYLGHGPETMTELYTFGQLPGQLTADAKLLQAYRATVTR